MANDQVKYGSIVVLHKDGPSPRPHSLKLGPTTIGSAASCDIRVKTILSRTVQCIIATKDNGLVTIENKSKAHPVYLNGTILKSLEVLIDGDKFEVAGRAFQYINDKQKNRNDLMKILQKSSTRRQTTAAEMSSSKIPVSSNASKIPVKKKRSLSLSESKENKRSTVTRLCATAASSNRTTRLVSPGRGLRKVLFDEISKDQCGPNPFLALDRRTRRSQSLTDRSLIQADLTSSHSSSIKLDERVNDEKSPVKSPSLSLQLPYFEDKSKTPTNNTSPASLARKSMKKISEECNIENETIDLIDFDTSNVLPLPRNEESQILRDAEVSTPQGSKSELKSPQSNSRVGRSKSRTPVSLKSPIKPTSTAVEINKRHMSVDEETGLSTQEFSQSLSEVEEFVSPQKDDEDNLQEEDEIPSPNYEVISPNTNGFGNETLVATLNSGNLSAQPVTDDDSTFFTPTDNTLNNSNKSDSFQLQLEPSIESPKGRSLVQLPSKRRNFSMNSAASMVETSLQENKSPRRSKPQTPIVDKKRNSRKCSTSSPAGDVNESVETSASLNNLVDSNLAQVAESDPSTIVASTPKWTSSKNSTAVFTRSGRKCSLPLKFREFQSVSSTPKSAVKKCIVENVIMETSYEMKLSVSEASSASTANSTSTADFISSNVDMSNFETADDVLKNAQVSDARAKSLTPVRAKKRLNNMSLPLLKTADCEESISSLPKELESLGQQSPISVSDVSQNDSIQSDANNSVIFKPLSTPPASKLPASSYITPPSVQRLDPMDGNTPVKENKSVRFSDTYVPKPRTPITRLKIRSLTPASVKTKRFNQSLPLTAIGLSSVAENLEDSIQKTEEDAGETSQVPDDSPRKSKRMSARKTSIKISLNNISEVNSIFGDESCITQPGEIEEKQTPLSSDRKSVRMSSQKLPTLKDASVVPITDAAEASTFSETGDIGELSNEGDIEQTPQSAGSSNQSGRASSRKSPKTPKETSEVNRFDTVAEGNSSVNGDGEESNGENKVKQTPQTLVSIRKSVRMSSRKSSKTPKDVSVFNISDSVCETSSFSENNGNNEESNSEGEVEQTAETSILSRKSARMSSRKSSKTQKETSVFNISDSVTEASSFSEKENTEESNNKGEVEQTPETPILSRKSARMSSRKSSKIPNDTSILNISDSVAEASSFSEKENTEQSNNKGEVEQTPKTPILSRKSARMSSKSQKETSVFNISDSVAEASSFSEKETTEESYNKGEVEQTPETSILSRKSSRMSSRKSSKIPNDTSVLNISDSVAEASSFSEKENTEESNNKGEVEQTPETPILSRKSSRMSSKSQKETSVFNISDSVAEASSFSEKENTEESNNKGEVEQTPETSILSRKSARMSPRKSSKIPNDTSVLNISDSVAEASSFSEKENTEESNNKGEVEQTPETPILSRKSARMSSKSQKETSVFNRSDSVAEASSFSEKENTEESNNKGEVEQTPETSILSRKSARMSARKSSKIPNDTSVLNISDSVAEASSFSAKENTEESNNKGEVEQTPETSILSRKSSRMSSRKSSKIPNDTSVLNISDSVAEASSFSEKENTEESNNKGEVEQTPETPILSRKSARMSSKSQKETSVFNISDSVAEASSFSEKDNTEESNNKGEVEQTPETSILSRKSARMSARKSSKIPNDTSFLKISDSVAEASSFAEKENTEESNNKGELEQTPETSILSRKSARMSPRKSSKIPNDTSVLNISDSVAEASSFFEKENTAESNNEGEVEQTPETSIPTRKSIRMSSRKSLKTPKETSVFNISNSFSEKIDPDKSLNGDDVEQTPQTSFSSGKGTPMCTRKVSRKSSIKSISDLGGTIATDQNSKAEDITNEVESVTEQQTPHTSSSPRKSVQSSSRKTPKDTTSKGNHSVINLMKKTTPTTVKHIRAKSETPGIVTVRTARKRSLPLLQKTLKKAAFAAKTPSSAKPLGKAETPVTSKSSEKEQTPTRKSMKRISGEIVKETLEGSPMSAFVEKMQSQINEETLAARKSLRMSKKKSVSGERTPIEHPRGTKRARDTPATIQSRKRRKLNQSNEDEDEDASMNSFYEEPSMNVTPKPERAHKPQKSPLNDLTKVSGLKRLMKTPRYQKSPQNDLSNIKGVKKLMATPKIAKSPLNDLSEVKGVKKLMRTPRVQKSPENDLQQVAGVKKMFASPKPPASPLNDLTNVDGVKDLMKLQNLPRNDLTDVEGVDVLFNAPQRKSDEIFDSLFEKKQVKTYQRKSHPTHVLEDVNNKNQRVSSANQASCSPRVNQWVEESLQHLEKIKHYKVNLESSKLVESVDGTESKRATPLRTSRGKLPARYLEADYVFPKIATPKVPIAEVVVENDENATKQKPNTEKLTNKEIVAVTENKTEETVTRKRNRLDEKKSDQIEKVSKNKKAKEADEKTISKYLEVPQRVTRKRIQSCPEPNETVLESKKTKALDKAKLDTEMPVLQKATRKRSIQDVTPAPAEKVRSKRTAKNDAASSENGKNEEMPPPPRSTRKAAKKATSEDSNNELEDAPHRSVKNKRTAKKNAADFGNAENEGMPPPRSTRKVAKKETLEDSEDASRKPVNNKGVSKKNATDSENEEMSRPRSTRKAAKKETLEDSSHEDAPQISVKNKRLAKKNAANSGSSENEEVVPPRSTRKAGKKETLEDPSHEDAPQISVTNKKLAKKNTANFENEEVAPPRSTRKAGKKETLEDPSHEDAPQISVTNKRLAKKNTANSGNSENVEVAPPRSTRKAGKKETLKNAIVEPKDVPQRSLKNKKTAKNATDSGSSENEEIIPSRSTRKGGRKETAVEDINNERQDAPQRSTKKRKEVDAADSEPQKRFKRHQEEETGKSSPPQENNKNKTLARSTRYKKVEPVEIEPPSTSQKRTKKQKNQEEDKRTFEKEVLQKITRHRKQDVEVSKKTVKFTEAKSAVVEQQKTTSRTRKEPEKVTEKSSSKTRATQKPTTTAEQKKSTKTAIKLKVQTASAPQPRAGRKQLPVTTRSTRSSKK